MSQYKDFQGKNLDDAINEACAYYGVEREKLEIEIVNDAKTGIFGLVGAKKARIRAARVQPLERMPSAQENLAPASEIAFTGSEMNSAGKGGADKAEQRQQVGSASHSDNGFEKDGRSPIREKRGKSGSVQNSDGRSRNTLKAAQGESVAKLRELKEAAASSRAGAGSADSGNSGGGAQVDNTHNPRSSRRKSGEQAGKNHASGNARVSAGVTAEQVAGSAAARRQNERGSGNAPGRSTAGWSRRDAKIATVQEQSGDQDFAAENELSAELAPVLSSDPARDDLPEFPLEKCDRDELVAVVSEVIRRLVEPIVGTVSCMVEILDKRVRVSVDCGEASGLLVGREGHTLSAVQHLAVRIIARRIGGSLRLQIDTGKYRERQDDRLKEMALALAERVKATRNAQSTRPLSAYQRRIVHLALEDDEAVQTHSKGEGAQRRVVIQPKRVAGRGKEGSSTSIEEARQQTADRQLSLPGSAGENGGNNAVTPQYETDVSTQDDFAAEPGLLSQAATAPPEAKESKP